jgi:hypothetical protein
MKGPLGFLDQRLPDDSVVATEFLLETGCVVEGEDVLAGAEENLDR